MDFNNETFQKVNSSINQLHVTKLHSFEGRVVSSGLSIKLPIKGIEHYCLNNKYHSISPGKFLVVNKGEEVTCSFNSKTPVEAFCLYLDYNIYSEVLDRFLSPDELDNKSNFRPEIISETYHFQSERLSNTLKNLISLRNVQTIPDYLFFTITEQLAHHQLKQHKLLSSIKAQKKSTKKELLCRLRLAKYFVQDNYKEQINLDDISKASCLSKYHLLRSFKTVYDYTPYCYLNFIRIKKAKELLKKESDIFEVAQSCGFNDRRSFTRSFKKETGESPSSFQKKFFF